MVPWTISEAVPQEVPWPNSWKRPFPSYLKILSMVGGIVQKWIPAWNPGIPWAMAVSHTLVRGYGCVSGVDLRGRCRFSLQHRERGGWNWNVPSEWRIGRWCKNKKQRWPWGFRDKAWGQGNATPFANSPSWATHPALIANVSVNIDALSRHQNEYIQNSIFKAHTG